MAIEGLQQDEFQKILRDFLTPARAIRSPELLRGREGKLVSIDRAFNSQGKHVFIFGDRGVGKTSLAQTAAILHQSSENEPLMMACEHGTSFFRIIRDIAKRCLPPRDVIEKAKLSEGFSLKFPGVSYDLVRSAENGDIPIIESINDAVNIFRFVSVFHSTAPVIIIDEFDQLTEEREKKSFADFIKQISDQDIPVRIIFCGIGSSLDELIGVHPSTGRYLAPIQLDRLSHDARWEIINSAADALGVSIGEEFLFRIGQISDGFPYYVHLIGEMIFWAMFDDPGQLTKCDATHFKAGVKGAVAEAEASLKFAYDKATQKYSDDYQEVLWAVADKAILRRQVSEIYDTSYVSIMRKRTGRNLLDKTKFYSRMNNLKNDRHGSILRAMGAGWYEFRENIVRGYVRLRAEEQGVQLDLDHYAS